MRIRELSLIRYGHFEGDTWSFPPATHDIHVVYGDNETGKSTALRALGDVLFEIPERTTMDFRFPKPKLRIGATLELGKEQFAFVRRKGRGNTIEDADGTDILDGEKTLKRFLAAADRELFERMFLLDHERLQSGSRSLLSGGDAGEAMLASSAGLEGLHELLQSLSAEAEGMWTPNRSMKRQFYKAKSALDAATKTRRKNTVEPREWTRANKAVEAARDAYDDMQSELHDKRTERARLDRIRRLHSDLTKLATAEQELGDLGGPVLLDEGAEELLRSARTEYKLIQGRIDTHETRINEIEDRVANLDIDETVLSLADDIQALNERRVQLQQHREDLPRRKVTRKTLKERIAVLAKDLGWSSDDENVVADRLPTRPLIDKARGLVTRHTKLTTEHENLAKQQRTAAAEKEEADKSIADLPKTVDLSELRIALRLAQDQREVVTERRRLETDVEKRRAVLANNMKAMAPEIDNEVQLTELLLPDREAISEHRDSYRECVSRLTKLNEEAKNLARQVESERREIEEEREEIGAMSELALTAARTKRDDAWELLAARYIRESDYEKARWTELFSGDARGDQRYPELVAIADQGADTRFKHAHDVGALANKERAQNKSEEVLDGLKEDIAAEEDTKENLSEQWTTRWSRCPISPSNPDTGLAWLDQAARCKTLLEELTEAETALAAARGREAAARAAIFEVLSQFLPKDTDLDCDDLEALIAAATEAELALQAQNEATTSARDTLKNAIAALSEANIELSEKDAALKDWGAEWQEVLTALGLDAATTPDTLDSYLGVIDELRDSTKELVNNVNDRIAKMEGDLERYEVDVRQLTDTLGMGDIDTTGDPLVNAFVLHLRESQSNDETRSREKVAIETERNKLDGLRENQREHDNSIARLAELAGTGDDDALTEAASASDRRRALESDVSALAEAIEKNGDSKSLSELRAESEGVDLDTTIATIEQLEQEIAVLDAEFPERRDALTSAENALAGIGEHGDAARAEWERQQALADLGQVAERYVRTATASALLRWSIDRFRIQHQKPLLDRASALFSMITRGSFERVTIEYDDDQPVLAGRRPDGEVTSLEGMSSGSRDQLYLALRLAAVEDYAAKASAMPFVGDDLFIQHDKKRTHEALTALTALSKTCQVILFSHDEAFVQLARDVLPDGANLIEIEPAASA